MAHVAGKAIINIVPSMKGFRSTVDREISHFGRTSGRQFGTSLNKSLSSIKFKSFNNFTPLSKLEAQSSKTVSNITKIFDRLPASVQKPINSLTTSVQKITLSPFVQKITSQVASLSGRANSAFSKINMGSITSKFKTGFGGLGGIAKVGMAGVVGAVTAGIGAVSGVVSSLLPSAIQRFDTLNRFPKILGNLNVPADVAKKALERLDSGAQGLPTTLDTLTQAYTQFAGKLTSGKSAQYVADLTVALNDMSLAGGASFEESNRAMVQFTQMLNTGKVDMQSWRTVMEVMPGQLNQLAQSMLGAGATGNELYDALQDGTVSMADFEAEIIKMSRDGGAGFASFHEQALTASSGIVTSFTNLKTSMRNILTDLIPEGSAAKIDFLTERLKTFRKELNAQNEEKGLTGGLLYMLGFNEESVAQLQGYIESVKISFLALFENISTGFSSSAFNFSDLLANFGKLGEALNGFFAVLQPVFSGIGAGIGFIVGVFGHLVNFVVMGLTVAVNALISAISFVTTIPATVGNIFSTVVSFVSSGISNIVSFFTSLPSRIRGAVGNLSSIGRYIIDGIVSGVTGAAGRLVSSAVNAVKNALNAAKSALGIHSPSRVFRDEVGKQITAGIAVGVTSNSSIVGEAIAGVSNVTSIPVNTAGVPVTSVIGNPVNRGVGNVTFNIYEQNPETVASIVLNRLNSGVR